MAIPVIRNESQVAVKSEVTEGTFVPVSANTDFIQPTTDGFSMVGAKEVIERSILTASIGMPVSRSGLRSVSGDLQVEYRASGIEGGTPDFDLMLESALGNVRTIAAQVTTKAAGHTVSVMPIEDADIGDFTIGDIIIILESGDHTLHAVKAVDTSGGAANITICPDRLNVPSASVVISKSRTYFPGSTGPTLSMSYFWGNEILQKGLGCQVSSLSLAGITTGGTATFDFSFQGLDFDELDGTSGFTPVFDSSLPPVHVNTCLSQDCSDTPRSLNEFTLTLENTLSMQTDICAGNVSARNTLRKVTGTFNPFTDDTSVTDFTNFTSDTLFELFVSSFNPSSVTGEIELGSAIGIYLPNCKLTGHSHEDLDGLVINALPFEATTGESGATDEIFIGMV